MLCKYGCALPCNAALSLPGHYPLSHAPGVATRCPHGVCHGCPMLKTVVVEGETLNSTFMPALSCGTAPRAAQQEHPALPAQTRGRGTAPLTPPGRPEPPPCSASPSPRPQHAGRRSACSQNPLFPMAELHSSSRCKAGTPALHCWVLQVSPGLVFLSSPAAGMQALAESFAP